MTSPGAAALDAVPSFAFFTTPADVVFTDVFRDKRYRGSSEIQGSEGKLISRAYLQSIVEKRSFAPQYQKQLLQDLTHANSVMLHSGKYSESFQLVDTATESIVAPQTLQSFFNAGWRSGVENVATPTLPYIAISKKSARADEIPFLGESEWHILSRDAKSGVDRYASAQHTFGQEKPTLSWVSGGKIRELYIKGKDTNAFLEAAGLRLTLPKGPFTAAKRLSRIFRPYKRSRQFEAEQMQFTLQDGRFFSLEKEALTRSRLSHIDGSEVSHFRARLSDGQTIDIRYMTQNEREAKVWDGAGVVSRAMLARTLITPELSEAEKRQRYRAIEKMGRVEYTILTPAGQDKGHAIVADDLSTDFLLPQDTKTAVQLVNGTVFVGFSPVKAKDQLALDEQTMINHHLFLPPDQLVNNLKEKSALYEQGVANGVSTRIMEEIGTDEQLENLPHWPFREFMASGGNPLWSASHTRTVYNQYLNQIGEMGSAGRGKIRLPTLGGRYYVMPAPIGRRAGVKGLDIGRGEIQLDKANATAWVNEEDWLRLTDGQGKASGIASILGGADNDDALVVIPFTDEQDDQRKLLVLRNPNEAGEYVLLKPTARSRTLTLENADGERVVFPQRDSRYLTQRIDQRQKSYLHLIDPESGPASQTEAYTVEAMESAINRAIENAGIFERYANFLMVAEAIGYQTTLPDGLETLVDGMNKTGADLRPVAAWLEQEAEKMIAAGVKVPDHLQLRTPKTSEGERPLHTLDHWIDQRQRVVQAHIDEMGARREARAAAARMPAKLFDSVFAAPNTIQLGAGYLQQYSRHVKQLLRQRPSGLRPEDYAFLRKEAEQHLNQYPERMHNSILRGALVSLQLGEKGNSDAALWLRGERLPDGGYRPGIGNKMNAALREIGLLGEPMTTKSGTVLYYDPEPQVSTVRTVGIRDVWFHHYRWEQEKHRQPLPETKGDIPKNLRTAAKQKIAKASQTSFRKMRLRIKAENGRFVAYTENGNLFGLLDGEEGFDPDEETITIQYAYAVDGNVRIVIQPDEQITGTG